MPSVSAKQHRFMEMIAHNPAEAAAHGIKPSVGEDFVHADTAAGLHFGAAPKRSRAQRVAIILSERGPQMNKQLG